MFLLSSDIIIDKFKPFKCTSATWRRSMSLYADYASITIPALCMLKKSGDQYDKRIIATGHQFKEGMSVEIKLGYDGVNKTRFKGFISRINFSVPLEIECEGYSYQLRTKMVNKTYTQTTIKNILSDLVNGTDIVLSKAIPDIPVSKIVFINYTGVQVLEWLKDKMLLTVFFNLNELYVGLRYTSSYGSVVKHRLNWNVIKDNALTFDEAKNDVQVNIRLDIRTQSGPKKSYRAITPGNEKTLHAYGINPDSSFLHELRNDHQKQNDNKGYSGKLTAFLEPMCDINMISQISDGKYESRTGKYLIEGVDGSFSSAGGRQTIEIGIKL